MRHPEVAPVAATGNIDAALDVARTTASASQLEAGSRQILDSWAAQRGHHKRVFGMSSLQDGLCCQTSLAPQYQSCFLQPLPGAGSH